MALFEDMLKGGNIVSGLAIGIGIALVGPALRPILRPVAKSLLKAGISAYEQGRLAVAELNEQAGDVMAEARAEMQQEESEPASNGHGRAEPSQSETKSHRSKQQAGT